MTWALKRQIFYIFVLISFFVVLAALVLYPSFNKPPTCFDGKQNGTETGVDCGGSCALACLAEVDEVSVLWARAFRVVPGRYNAVAYLENQNNSAVIKKINYRFRFADKDNIYIGQREGSTYVPAGGPFTVFEPGVDTGNTVPVYTTFEFMEAPFWTSVIENQVQQTRLLTSNIELAGETDTPRMSATVRNNSLYAIPEIAVVAILYDKFGNAISASRSFIDELKAEESAQVYFTWPEPFGSVVVSREVLPAFDISKIRIR